MIENLLNRLDGVKQTGPDKWVAQCPAHDDRSPSLSLKQADDRVLIHCFGGCYVGDVVAAVGLELKDLFPASNLTKKQKKAYQNQKTRAEIEAALSHEIVVMDQIVGPRVAERKLAKDAKFRQQRPDWMPMPDEHWDRELLAASRIRYALEKLYG